MQRLDLDEEDCARIASLGHASGAVALLELIPPDQREAVQARVVDERGYAEIAAALETSETVVRKRVSRGLAAVRNRMGPHR
jgi:DNA-directed RNA polymerase specialized sigma24 family protein